MDTFFPSSFSFSPIYIPDSCLKNPRLYVLSPFILYRCNAWPLFPREPYIGVVEIKMARKVDLLGTK
jgi:hypothetical protein